MQQTTWANLMAGPSLYSLVVQNECRNTHHKLVMNSLKRLQGPDAEKWADLLTHHFDPLLRGSKDPDTKFKDFRNHVIHVSENHWGGAAGKAKEWYDQLVEHLKNKEWALAAYAAGVMSHYYMDPLMPLHTGQTEEEGVIHRAAEWSVNKSFAALIEKLEAGEGYPNIEIPCSQKIKEYVNQGAEFSHQFYDDFIDHYNISLGSRNPPAGLDEHLQMVSGQCLAFASVGFARLFESAVKEAAASPGKRTSFFVWGLYAVTSPFSWFSNRWFHSRTKSQVNEIKKEFDTHGKVINALPKDEKQVRRSHAKEVLNIPIEELDQKSIREVGAKFKPDSNLEQSASQRRNSRQSSDRTPRSSRLVYRLDLDSDLEDAPSIGKKTAARFATVGIESVKDFLNANPELTAQQIDARHISPNTIRQWQTQAKLACEIPNIYGHDAQILVGCGFDSPDEVANSKPANILQKVDDYGKTKEAEFVMRGKVPDSEEVTNWIEWSKSARKVA